MDETFWVVFRDPHNTLTHMEKYVVAIVRDCDIVSYQKDLAGSAGTVNEIVRDMSHIQPFVYAGGFHYYIRKYVPWSNSQ